MIHKLNKTFLLFLLMMVMGVGSAWAQTTPSKWDGTVSASLSTQDGTTTNAGKSSNPYLIQSAADLAYFGSKMNGKDWYVKLTVDIDLDNREWTYGENSASNFKGHFDGNGKTISNLSIVPVTKKNNGFFSSLQGTSASHAEVKNLTIDGVKISQTVDLEGTTVTGALAGNVTEYTDIDNVTVKNVTITLKNLTNANYVGGFTGRVQQNNCTLTTCSVEKPTINITGEIKGGASFIGGAIGQFAGSANLVSTIDGLTVTSPSVTLNKISIKDCYIGAVFGRINTYSTVKSVTTSSPTLTYKNDGAPNVALNIGSFAGGIFGVAAQETAVTGTKVTGDAAVKIGTSNNVQNVKAGLIGQSTTNVSLEGWTIESSNIQVNGNLATASSYLGGFVGYVVSATNAPVTIKKTHVTGNTNVTVSGNVSIACYIGGQFGYLAVANAANNSVIVDDFEVDENKETKVSIGGNVGGGANYVGGFIGYAFGRTQSNTEIVVNKANIGTTDVTVGGTITGAKDVFTYIGGYVGLANSGISKFTSCSVSPTVNINGDIQSYAAYIGGAFGDFAGAAGYTSTIDGLTIGTASMTVNKVSVAGCYIGSVFGRINTYTTVNKVTANNPALTYNNTDNPGVALNLGTFAGYITGVANMETPVTNVTIGGTAQLTLGTEAKQGTTEIKAINAGLVGTATTNARLEGWTIGNSNIQVWGNLTTTASKLGGLVGYAASANLAQTRLKDITITGATNVNVPGNIGVASYVGGVIGDCLGVLTNGIVDATVFDGMSIASTSVTVNNCSVASCNIGSVFGRIQNYNEVNDITVSNPALSYNNANNSNVSLFLGTFAGYAAGIAAIKETPITKVTINGTAQLTIGTDAKKATTEAQNIKAGLIGQAEKNVRLEGWTIANSNVKVYGKLTTTGSQIGAFAGNLTGAANAPVIAKTVKITGSSSLNVSGDITVASYLGGFIGQASTNCRLEGCEVTKPTVVPEGELKTATSYVGGAIAYIKGAAGNTSFIDGLTVTTPKVDIAKISVTQRVGAVFGSIDLYDNINNVTVSSPKLNYSAAGNPNVDLYLGTFAGYLNGVKEQETPVTNVTITGTAELIIGTEANKGTTNISKVRAGLLGYTKTNVRLEDWTVANSIVQAYGSLTATADYFGGIAGSMESDNSAPLILKNVKITGNSTVNVTGNMGVGSYLGGFAGAIGQGSVTYSQVNIDDAGVDGVATVSVGGNVTAAGYVGGFTGYLYGKANTANQVTADNVSVGTTNLTITGQTTAGSYYGGLAGRVNTMCELNGWNVKTASNLTFNGNITALSYVGGAIGSMEGAASYPVSATGFDIKGIDVNFNCDITTKGIYVGGIVGQMTAIDTTPNKIEKSSVRGKIHTTGSHIYTNGNLPYTFGGIVGYLPQSTTTFSEVNNCVSEVDFDLSGLTPATSGNMYSGFVVGGVIGRINTPSRLPESLYYSGKIYAPTAGVGPIVGVFVKKLDDNKYIYDDYTGVTSAISAEEWAKADDWYFNGYKIGLSSDVTSQTLNTTASPVEGYLTIGKETLTNANPNSTADKISKTILAYAAVGDISPAWTTNKNTYPAYYMYYMQGVNRGNYLEDDKVEETKKDILSGKLAILILTDVNADFTKEANRGVISHALTATVSSSDGVSYKWYVDGIENTEATSATFNFKPDPEGNTIAVEAIKGGKALKKVECKVYPVFRVKNISNDTELYGTKTNPYLIGSTDELQLLSYLSTLPLNTPWEKTYTSDNHYNKAYYELDGDIDLSGVADFTPISFATGFNANNGMNLGYVFDGVFDGKQHKISGLKEEWYGGVINAKDSYLGWGLFSVVGSPMPTIKVGDSQPSPAVIRNLIIDGATLTHQTGNKTFNYDNNTANNNTFNNVGIGVLAGIVQNNTKIENIEIRNSKITDEGSGDYSLATGGLYVGGAVGTIQNAFNEIAAPVDTKLQHIAAQVDITLEHPKFADTTKPEQLGIFNIGGIIGRYCATTALQAQAQATMPAYTLYSGSVNAPKAWISPVLGATRYQPQNGVTWNNYSKIWEGNNNSTATQITITNAQYYNFRINGELITELYPEEACLMGARPISFQTDATEAVGTYSATKYQGVNYSARFIDSEGTTLRYLCEGVTDGVYWIWNDGFPHMTDQPYKGAYLESAVQTTFTAHMENGTANAYKWQMSVDGETWLDIPDISTQTCTPASSVNRRLIVAVITTDGGVTYRTQAEIVMPTMNLYAPYIEQSGNDSEGYTFTVNWNENEPDVTKTVTYQWYHNDKTTPYTGATGSTFNRTKSELDEEEGLVWCEITVKDLETEIYRGMLRAGRIVVFVDGANGVDNAVGSRARGWTPETAVKTIDNANLLLDGGTWDNNIVVVIGTLNADGDFRSTGSNPATITGLWDGVDYEGVIKLKQINPQLISDRSKTDENYVNPVNVIDFKGSNCYVKADTKFEYLTFQANDNGAGNNFIECHGNDIWFGKGLVMTNFCNLSKSHGNLLVAENIPELTIVLTATNLNEDDIRKYTNRTRPQTLTIESGRYGRIMGGRYTNGFFAKAENTSHTILGSAEHPVWAIVNINIDKENPNKGTINRKEDPNKGTVTDDFTCDINCIIAGLTDGTMYGDYTINVHGGKIGYIVGGNQGNPVPNGSKTFTQPGGNSDNWGQWPNSSYFGRTVINVEQDPELKDIVINNLYAGGLGREANGTSATSIVDMYMYGHTEINMKSGTVTGNVYGGGAGGVIGINPWDMHVPYATTETENATNAIMNGVQYGEWGAKKAGSPLANVTLHDSNGNGGYITKQLNLGESYTTLNISGGTINGSVYGGGCGYVSNMPKEVVMQGVGSVFGTSNVNISGGTIHGSVYGGSEGSDKYYGAENKYFQTINHIAEMNGTVNMIITYDDPLNPPTIDGSIYGGGMGIVSKSATEEYLRIATAGNYDLAGPGATEEQKSKYKTDINITIDMTEDIEFPNDIYGGGALGKVDGNTNIILKRGQFTGSIYGGGYGELQHLDKAMVTGTTNIYTGAIDPSDVNREHPVSILPVDSRIPAIYGGGNMAQVKGDTYINLWHGNITADVFGGGKGLVQGTDYGKVTGDTHILYNNVTDGNKVIGNIYGGGALGAVDGNTEVKIGTVKKIPHINPSNNVQEDYDVNICIEGDIYGGSKGVTGKPNTALVTGDTKVIIGE